MIEMIELYVEINGRVDVPRHTKQSIEAVDL